MAKLKFDTVGLVVIAIVIIVVVFTLLASVASDVGNAANNLTEVAASNGTCVSGGQCGGSVYPLANLFKSKGVILLAFMLGIIITFVTASFIKEKSNGF